MFFTSAIIAQEGEVVVNQDKQIETLLRLKKEVNKTLVNYRIQIFNGNRQGAEKARDEFVKVFSSWKPDMKFQTPNYKIWVGEFKTRLEADRALLQIKKEFRNAFIIKL
ncbi:SPOR domain-containing protein [Pontimicrobium aquaticum]|nr:SPOR domain-containing protein [Pontimicrobium aquaticum]